MNSQPQNNIDLKGQMLVVTTKDDTEGFRTTGAQAFSVDHDFVSFYEVTERGRVDVMVPMANVSSVVILEDPAKWGSPEEESEVE